jgi:hypothetical protein
MSPICGRPIFELGPREPCELAAGSQSMRESHTVQCGRTGRFALLAALLVVLAPVQAGGGCRWAPAAQEEVGRGPEEAARRQRRLAGKGALRPEEFARTTTGRALPKRSSEVGRYAWQERCWDNAPCSLLAPRLAALTTRDRGVAFGAA